MTAPDHRRRERPAGRRLVAILLALAAITVAPAARADESERIAELSETLGKGHTERERIAACTALARLGSKTALRPLVIALKDTSPTVRGIAAAGLGKLGHRAALPALRLAQADGDAVVQKRAAEAIVAICAANSIPVAASPTSTVTAVKPAATTGAAASNGKAGFGNQPRAVAPRSELFIVIKSASDDSPGKYDKKARKVHADTLRAAMATELAAEQLVTTTPADAVKFGIDARNLDLSVVSLELRADGAFMEVEAQLRLAISDDSGRMLSFVSGGARVQVPRRGYDLSYLPQLRRDALENAVRGLFAKLIDQLRVSMTS